MDISTAKDDEEIRHDGASTASPQSSLNLATSPSAFLSFSDHTFTPWSMDDDTNSEPYSDDGGLGDSIRTGAKSAFGLRSSPHRDIDSDVTAAIRTATRPTRPKSAGKGVAGKVMTLVQSIDEHLHATTNAGPPQYELSTPSAAESQPTPSTPTGASPRQSRQSSPSHSYIKRKSLLAQDDRQVSEPSSPKVAPQNTRDLHHHTQQASARGASSVTAESPKTERSGSTLKAVQLNQTPPATSILRPRPVALTSAASNVFSSPTVATTDDERVRTASTCSVPICHPTPDVNSRSRAGSCRGNIAALEATAEQFALTDSIEDAIREAHEELKRSESRRSSILRANGERTDSDDESSPLSRQISRLSSRQNSILGTNGLARLGGYSPAGYVLTPTHSISNASPKYRSLSKRSSIAMLKSPTRVSITDANMDISEEAGNGENFPTFLSRHGSTSVRSIVSSKMSLAEIAETEPPMTLTQQALDDADRAAAAGQDSDDEDTIRASAHQHTQQEDEAADVDADNMETPHANEVQQPLMQNDFFNLPTSPILQVHQPDDNHYRQYDSYDRHHDAQEQDRPLTSGSGGTCDQAENAFGDFDGVHFTPESVDDRETIEGQQEHVQAAELMQLPGSVDTEQQSSQQPQDKRQSRFLPTRVPAARPKSYFDAETGQQMLYYPARVPAMLNLPPKLSKHGNNLAARAKVRSQVLSVLPQDSRQSRIWLPDPLTGLGDSSTSLANPQTADRSPARASFVADSPEISQHGSLGGAPSPSQGAVDGLPEPQQREMRTPRRLKDASARKSHMPVAGDLPAHLRASVFFDLPSDAPQIVVKDQSAIATLDSILDASASAPVSAFTDHAFAGKLGTEIYGLEKQDKRKSRMGGRPHHSRGVSSTTNLTVLEPKKRASFLSLLSPGRKSSENLGLAHRRNTMAGGESGLERALNADSSSSSKNHSPDHDYGLFSPNTKGKEAESDGEPDNGDIESQEGTEDDNVVIPDGPPTTLLAELQLRKQRNKMRTRPVQSIYSNGVHSTLLELDTVAQVEREMRKQKKVNLAWEDPALNPDLAQEEDDEEVPLALLAAAKAASAAKGVSRSTLDLTAIMDEVHRPLGLMERREMEENEPLSRRRDRLQGRAPPETVSLETMQKRMTTLNLVNGVAGLKSQSRLNLPLPDQGGASGGVGASTPGEEPEVEGETLAERRKRLHGETPLPFARPVSRAFSSELLSQFGGDDSEGKGKGKNAGLPGEQPEEGETLGQRRRRLQAERAARQREMGSGWTASNPQLRGPYNGGIDGNQRISRRLSMADILADHPLEGPGGMMDPREKAQLQREQEAERVRREQEAKMAHLRAQMPQNLPAVSVGAYSGAFRGSRYDDDGTGRRLGSGSGRSLNGQGLGFGVSDSRPGLQPRMSAMPAAYGVPAQSVYGYGGGGGMAGVQSSYGMMPGPAAYGGMYNGYGVPPAQQVDMVERWRQSIMPN